MTKVRQARRLIDGSVIETVGARRFLKLIEAEPVYFIGFPSKWDMAFAVHKLLGNFLHDAR